MTPAGKYESGTTSTLTTLTEVDGVSVRENSATPNHASVSLRDTSDTGALLAHIEVDPEGSESPPLHIRNLGRIYVHVEFGTVQWSIWGR
jgi:hypothetical protein